jgi:hypothetical protein
MNADELKKELAYEKDFWEFAESVMIEAWSKK